MKLIVEEKDIKEIKEVASHIGVALTDLQSKEIIEQNESIACELYEYGSLECNSVSLIWNALVKKFSTDENLPKMHWPNYGDSKEYNEKFKVYFQKVLDNPEVSYDKNFCDFL